MVQNPKNPSATVAFVLETGSGDVAVVSCRSGGVDCGAVCGLLMERLHDVSVHFVCLAVLFVNGYVVDLCVCSGQAVSLTKVAENIITEDNSDDLQRWLVVLEEENSWLKASTAELRESVDKSAETMVSLWQTLNGAIVDYELLKDDNNNLLAKCDTLRDQVAGLDSELVTAKASTVEDITTLEAKVASIEACVVDDAVAGEKHLVDFEAELARDLADLPVTYERDIQSIGGLCSPICPSAANYVCWFVVEVASLRILSPRRSWWLGILLIWLNYRLPLLIAGRTSCQGSEMFGKLPTLSRASGGALSATLDAVQAKLREVNDHACCCW
jgi:hypothetical protein